jgi:hypothetical protein
MGYAKPSKWLKLWVVSQQKSSFEVHTTSQSMRKIRADKACEYILEKGRGLIVMHLP